MGFDAAHRSWAVTCCQGKLLLDIDENRYLIPQVEKLSERDRRLFTRFIYW